MQYRRFKRYVNSNYLCTCLIAFGTRNVKKTHKQLWCFPIARAAFDNNPNVPMKSPSNWGLYEWDPHNQVYSWVFFLLFCICLSCETLFIRYRLVYLWYAFKHQLKKHWRTNSVLNIIIIFKLAEWPWILKIKHHIFLSMFYFLRNHSMVRLCWKSINF